MTQNEIFTISEYHEAYPPGIARHFWNIARNDVIYRHLSPYLHTGELVMDVGCGIGIVVNELKSRGINIRGVELGAPPLPVDLQSDIAVQTDVFDLVDSLKQRIQVVLLLDVLEHIENRRVYLQRISSELPNCRLLLLTVPARMELWSSYDEYWGHHLRYDRVGLEAELSESGFVPHITAYFFHWVYLASALLSFLGVSRKTHFQPIEGRVFRTLFHRILGWITKLESRLVPGWVVGSSIVCIASRTDAAAPTKHSDIYNAA